MDKRTRDLFLRVNGGDPKNLPFLYLIDCHKHKIEILEFLISRGLTGRILSQYIFEKCGGEPIKFLAHVTKDLLKLNVAPALKKGINFN